MLRIWFMVGMCILLMAFPGVSSTHGADVLTQNMQETLQNLPYVHGQRVSEATFDQKVVIVTFFASWCPPCREEFSHLRKLHAEYHASGVEVIAVNLFGMITRIPTLFVFDRHGQHVLRFANEAGGQQMTLDLSTLRQTISRLL
jgi:thiol-disulfide isomerase/thioredoxin